MRVRPYKRQLSIAPQSQAQAVPTPPAGDFGLTAGKTIGDITTRLQKIQQDTEDARTLELFNKFKQDSNSYHEDPKKGIYNTRLGFLSQGVYDEADQWLRAKGEEYVNMLNSARAKDNFRRIALDHITQQGVANSRFEAAQTKRYQQEQADATIKNGLNEIGLNPYDDDAVERIRQNMTAALELKLRDAPPEKQREAMIAMENDIASARLNTMIIDMPLEAETWFNEHKDLFNAQSALRYGEAVKNAAELFKIQSAVDDLVKAFPPGDEQEGLSWIRQNFSGELEERIVSAFKTRANELALDLNRDSRLLKLQQDNLENQILKQFYVNGIVPTDTQLKQFVADNRLRYEQAANIQSRANASVNRSRYEREILAADPNLSQLELDNAVMRKMGITQQAYQRTFTAVAQSVMSGQMNDSELDYLYQRGMLTKLDVENFKKRSKGLDDVQKSYYRAEQQDLNNTIKELINVGLPENLAQGIRDKFAAGEALLEPKSKTYRDDLLKLKKKALIDAIDQSGERLNGYLWGKTNIGEMRSTIQDQTLQIRGIDPFPTLPDILPSPITLNDTVNTNESPVFGLVRGGVVPQGGGFDAPRTYRNGTHNGLDIAIQGGSEITMTDFGTPLTVSRVNTTTPSKGAGNSVTLKGKYPTGDTIEITLGHMQNDSINVQSGDVVAPGTVIGLVGNTGQTSDKKQGKVTDWYEGKDSGFHVDIKIKINGKYIDPAKFNPNKFLITNSKLKPEDIFHIPNYSEL